MELSIDALQEDKPILRDDVRLSRSPLAPRSGNPKRIVDYVLRGVSHPGIQVGSTVFEILKCLDGATPMESLPVRLRERAGISLDLKTVLDVVQRLDQLQLLDTPQTRQSRASLEAALERLPYRPMLETGTEETLYSRQRLELERVIAGCFAEDGAEGLPCRDDTYEPLSALMVPHGTYAASGRCAARALRELARGPLPDLYIIIGPNHVFPRPEPRAETILQPFETPLGTVEVAKDVTQTLFDAVPAIVKIGHISQHFDHSIEIILPLLQWLHQRILGPDARFKLLPLLLSGPRPYPGIHLETQSHRQVWRKLGAALAALVSSRPERIVLIASGDLTHWGAPFEFIPFESPTLAAFEEWDAPMLHAIHEGRPEDIFSAWTHTNACAPRPFYMAIQTFPSHPWRRQDYQLNVTERTATSFASYVA